MLIEFVSGPKQGKQEHVKVIIGESLIVAGIAKQINDPFVQKSEVVAQLQGDNAPVMCEPHWCIGQDLGGNDRIIFRRDTEIYYFADAPEPAAKWNCPAAIVKEFRARKTYSASREAAAAKERQAMDRAMGLGR